MLKEGTVIDDKYEILKQIGEGGMSTVYLARNNRMNMQLAVKEIKNDGSKSTEILLKGLEREANILKDVDHPVIPRIIDIVKYNNTICVVMDFIEGENLADKLKEVGCFSQDDVIDWGLELASALEYLHSMEDHAVARLQMKEKDHFIDGLEFAGAHGMSGDGMGPQITNGRAAAKAVREDLERKKEAAKK